MDKEEQKYDIEQIAAARKKAADALVEYLKTFRPEDAGTDSKHALMGPVGKLLTRLTTTGEINWEAVKGFVLSIHKNQQKGRMPASAAERLDDTVRYLAELRALLPPTKWLKTVEDLDDEVFFRVYKEKLVGQKVWVQKEFQEWLERKYKTIDRVNEIVGPDYGYSSFKDVEDPWSVPEELDDDVKEFWEERKKTKKEEQ
ncbi:MAG: beta-galactosidase [Candidatus Thorarchaeota archaeon]|nr:beta-galactosidase [Candidatus Thorarchaeota archaeon]